MRVLACAPQVSRTSKQTGNLAAENLGGRRPIIRFKTSTGTERARGRVSQGDAECVSCDKLHAMAAPRRPRSSGMTLGGQGGTLLRRAVAMDAAPGRPVAARRRTSGPCPCGPGGAQRPPPRWRGGRPTVAEPAEAARKSSRRRKTGEMKLETARKASSVQLKNQEVSSGSPSKSAAAANRFQGLRAQRLPHLCNRGRGQRAGIARETEGLG